MSEQSGDRPGSGPSPEQFGALCQRIAREAPEGPDGSVPEFSAHVIGCAACTRRFALRRQWIARLRSAPGYPGRIDAVALLDAVRERIVEDAEASAHGQWLAAQMGRVPGREALAPAPPVPDSDVASRLLVPPPSPSPSAWLGVRRSIRDEIHSGRAHLRAKRWSTGLLGAAAAAIVCGVVFSNGTPEPLQVVFVDLQEVPMIDLAALRSGIPR